MALNSACVGRRYTAPPTVIPPDRALAFARAVDAPTALPAPDLGRLPTLAAVYLLQPVVAQLFADREVGLDLPRLVHGEQAFTIGRAPRYGETLHPEGTIDSIETRRSLDVLRFELTARDDAGAVVTRGSSLFVIRRDAGGAGA